MATRSSEQLQQWRRLRLGFARARDGGFGLGLQGVRAAAIYRGARPLGVRATKAAAACGVARSDSQWSPARAREVGGDPDRRAPPVGGLRKGKAGTGWAGEWKK